MSTLAAEIHADDQRYRSNCHNSGEPVQYRGNQYGEPIPDTYGPHAKSLETRLEEVPNPSKPPKTETLAESFQQGNL